MRTFAIACFLIAATLAPAASAWSLSAAPVRPFEAATALPTASVHGAVACVLGDVNLDGHTDLLVRTVDAAGRAQFDALAGPDFQAAIWSHVASAQSMLQCAADIDADAVADPILAIAGQASAQLPAGQQQAQLVLQTLSGATGAVAVTRSITAGATGAAADGVAQAQQVASGFLMPAASGALAEVTTKATVVTGLVPMGVPAIPALDAQAAASATLRLLDATGRVAGTVTIDSPDVQPLALAPVAGAALPQVAALTATAVSQVEGAAAQVPTLSLYNADGTLAWAVELAATTGVPSLVPGIGDLDLDGVPDLLVQTVTGSVDQVPAAALTAVSGLDGHVLFATAEVSGWVAALPLGQVHDATAILQAAQATAESAIQISALDGAGQVLWTAEVAAESFAANLAFDAFTGELSGFTDLTGDAVPDVAAAVAVGSGLALTVIDGASGKVAWAAEVAGATDIRAIASVAATAQAQAEGAVSTATGLAGTVTPQLATLAGQASDLVAVSGTGVLNVSVIRGLDGAVAWSATATLPASQGLLDVQSAGDVDGDGQVDLLLSVGPVSADASADAGEATDAVAGAQAYVLSSVSGATVLATQVAGEVTGLLEFLLQEGPAYAKSVDVESSGTVKASPGAGIGIIAAVLGLALVLRRRE